MPDTSITLLDRLRSQPDEEARKRFLSILTSRRSSAAMRPLLGR